MSYDPNKQSASLELVEAWVQQYIFPKPQPPKMSSNAYTDKVGLEIEMGVYQTSSLETPTPAAASLAGPSSTTEWLMSLASAQGWQAETSSSPKQIVSRVILPEGEQLSFEPGGQVEISTPPYDSLCKAQQKIKQIQKILMASATHHGLTLIQLGMNPWQTPSEVGLQMSKPRYQAMNEYFQGIGPYGARMMRLTSTVQVNLDFGNSDLQLAKRYLLANLIAPVATASFAHSPYEAKQATAAKSRRSQCWQNLDPKRTGFGPGLARIAAELTRESCYRSYIDYALAAPIVFFPRDGYRVNREYHSFGEIMAAVSAGEAPTMAEFENHLSLLFPEVRPRGFLELRSIDCQAPVWQDVPSMFYCGLFYDNRSMEAAIDLLLPTLPKIHDLWLESSFGLDREPIKALAQEVMPLAVEGYSRLPAAFKGDCPHDLLERYADEFTFQGKTPADDLLTHSQQAGSPWLSPETIFQTQTDWAQFASATNKTKNQTFA